MIGLNANAQNLTVKSDFQQITETLMDYIEGTANGEPERLRKAFHPDFNLYTVTKDSIWSGYVQERNIFLVLRQAKKAIELVE
jgi:hypothetical protein